MNETPKNNRGWRVLRRILIVLATLATLIAILYAEEDWRGKRAWENYKREWEAKGEKFDWQAFVSPAVPDGQNFFTAPIFTNMLNGKIVMNPWHSDGSPNLHGEKFGYLGGGGKAFLTDLKQFQESYRNPTNASLAKEFPISPQPQTPAKDVLFALSKFDLAIEDLRQASQRPYANVSLNYEQGFNTGGTLLPYLAVLKRCTQVLQLRAVAELADGQTAKALDDVKLLLYLNNSLRNSPFLISHLVRMAIVAISMQPIWEGLAEHKWSDEQLVALDAELASVDFLADYEFAMRGERAFAIASFENQRRTRESISGFVTVQGNSGLVTNKLTLLPSAYFDQNELTFARMHQQWILPLVDTNSRTVSPAALQRAEKSVQAGLKHYSPYNVQAVMLFPAIGNAVKKFAAIQVSIDLARVACALERYRLTHGQYPDTLDALAPQSIGKLPHDIINGQPLHYRRTDGGQFILYSVGWNETDDGGTVVFLKGGSSVDREKGDWVWQYPVK
jgi:tetratricopeptide (TPR) repeat protein